MFELTEVMVKSRILLIAENISFFSQYFLNLYSLIKKSMMEVCFLFSVLLLISYIKLQNAMEPIPGWIFITIQVYNIFRITISHSTQ